MHRSPCAASGADLERPTWRTLHRTRVHDCGAPADVRVCACLTCLAPLAFAVNRHVNKQNPLTRDVTAHAFQAYVDGKAFASVDQGGGTGSEGSGRGRCCSAADCDVLVCVSSAMAGSQKVQPKVAGAKVKPNDPCPCGSAKKAKKCCHDPAKK